LFSLKLTICIEKMLVGFFMRQNTTKYAVRFLVSLFLMHFFVVQSDAQVKLTTCDCPPYTSNLLKDGGLTTKIVRQVFKKMGKEIVVDFFPWKRGYKLTEKGQYAATFPYLKDPAREKHFIYSEPVVLWESKLYVHRDAKIRFEKWEDLTGYVQCLPLGYVTFSPLEKLYREKKIFRVVTQDCWNMVSAGHADFFIEDGFVGEITKKKILGKAAAEVIALKKAISTDFGYVLFPKILSASEELANRFNKALKALVQQGIIQKIHSPDTSEQK